MDSGLRRNDTVVLTAGCHALVVRQAHHEVYFQTAYQPVDLILSLSKDEVVPLS
jgi:hypothetical protein